MSLSSADLTHLIAAAVLLLVAAHGLGRLAVRLHQPRVAGEILGGLLLGPTLFGLLAPGWQRAVFHGGGATQPGGIGGVGDVADAGGCVPCPTDGGALPVSAPARVGKWGDGVTTCIRTWCSAGRGRAVCVQR